MIKLFFLLIAIVFLAVGCSEDSTGPSSNVVIMPLAVGNEWVQRVTMYYLDGSIDTTYLDTIRIRDKVFDGSDTIYLFNSNLAGANRKNGYYIALSDSLQIIAKYPVFAGEVFRRDTSIDVPVWDTTSIRDTIISKFLCKETNTFVNVAAGSFYCYKYQIHTSGTFRADAGASPEYIENLIEYYYAPGIGEVKSYSYGWKDSLVLMNKRELVSYHLN